MGAAGVSASLLGLIAVLSPHAADAFWPFSPTRAADAESPVLHDANTRLLAAAYNVDPNPAKGETVLSLAEGSALVPFTGPIGTVVPERVAVSTVGSISTYTVKDGDSLSEIADAHGVSVSTLLWANDISDASLVRPGDELIILPVSGLRHTVKSGDTLGTVADKDGANAGDIASFNGLDAHATLVLGADIIIPGGELSASSKEKAATKKAVTQAVKASVKTGGSIADVNTATSGASEPSGYFGSPVPGALVTQGVHGWNGVDLGAPSGTAIYAAAAGSVIVSKIGGYNGGYGNYVVIDHGAGVQTLYSHMDADLVSVGDSVTKGQKIGTVGITGAATGYHLHFEVRGAKNPYSGCAEMTRCSPN